MRYTRIVAGVMLLVAVLAGWKVGQVTGQTDGVRPPSLQPPAPPSVNPPAPVVIGDATGTEKPVAVDVALPHDAGEGMTKDNPTGRQEPGVSLEWIGPAMAKMNQPVTYQIVVKNITTGPVSGPVHQVIVRNKLPAGVKVLATEPKAHIEGNMLTWELGTLQVRQEKRLDLQVLPEVKGDIACQAYVTFTGSSVARLRVREPKIAIKASAPDKVLLGDPATITLTVNNPGDGPADRVKIKALLPEGLEHPRGGTVEFDIGNLGPNETRSVQLPCTTKTGGIQKCQAIATAEDNLTARDEAALDVIMPSIELVAAGPKLRYLDRPASYTFKVVNNGSAPASNVTVTDQVPQGFKFINASDGGRHDFATRSVSWFIGDLAPAQSREVKLDLMAVNTGEFRHKAVATAARGIKAEADVTTLVQGLSALLMEAIDLDDPIEVGAETTYEVRVTNTGSKTETNLHLVCTIPDKLEFKTAKGPNDQCTHRVEGREVIFEPLPKLAPRADAVYRIIVKGTAPGDLRFRAKITADGLTEPVLKEESTKVYTD